MKKFLSFDSRHCDVEDELRTASEKTPFPWLSFPSAWEVLPVYPFGRATWRFLVRRKGTTAPTVSVYADHCNQLGYCNGPYWEVYGSNEPARCGLENIELLFQLIEQELGK